MFRMKLFHDSEKCAKEIVAVRHFRKTSLSRSNDNQNDSKLGFYEKESKTSSFLSAVAKVHKGNRIEFHKFKMERFKNWKERLVREAEISSQKYIKERHAILGPDLATAHFIVYRGGKVRFSNIDRWIEKSKEEEECSDLPNVFTHGYRLEAVDASNIEIRYEGMDNFVNLKYLKWLRFRNCPYVDDWFVDKISGEFSKTLEYLDLSDCKNVTQYSLSSMYRFHVLKTLVLNNIVTDKSFEFMCLLLEDAMPNLNIEGVKYMEVKNDP